MVWLSFYNSLYDFLYTAVISWNCVSDLTRHSIIIMARIGHRRLSLRSYSRVLMFFCIDISKLSVVLWLLASLGKVVVYIRSSLARKNIQQRLDAISSWSELGPSSVLYISTTGRYFFGTRLTNVYCVRLI